MTNTELVELKAALEAKRVELFTELRGHVSDLAIEDAQPESIDRIQSMAERAEIATLINRFTSTLANVERSLRDIDEDRYGACMACGGEIPLKRFQVFPGRLTVSDARSSLRLRGRCRSSGRLIELPAPIVECRFVSADDVGMCPKEFGIRA